jgi:cell wall-associated NlpC family hydrolase
MRIFRATACRAAAPVLWPLLWATTLYGANAVVLRPAANLHSAPSGDADVVSQAIYGTNLEVIEDRNNWSRVRTPDDYTGWVHKAWVMRSDDRYAAAGRIAKVTSLFASLYREASVTKHEPITTIPFETTLEVVGESVAGEERWLQVRLPDKKSAWMLSGDVTLNPEKLSVRAMVDLSRRFLGLPYLWGGTSTFGFDCSGFTQMLQRQRGAIMPRDAGMQAAWTGATHVERAALRAGDLLFFGASDKKIDHTGMYLGNGEFINATRHLKPVVQICKLSDPHWSKAYVSARRVK